MQMQISSRVAGHIAGGLGVVAGWACSMPAFFAQVHSSDVSPAELAHRRGHLCRTGSADRVVSRLGWAPTRLITPGASETDRKRWVSRR